MGSTDYLLSGSHLPPDYRKNYDLFEGYVLRLRNPDVWQSCGIFAVKYKKTHASSEINLFENYTATPKHECKLKIIR